MDAAKFTDKRTGRLVPIQRPDDVAFIPNPLPPAWNFDGGLWPALAEAKRDLGELNGIAQMLPNPELLLNPLQRVESLTSSRLEGTHATAQEVMLFELNPKQPHSATDESNAWLEVHNYTRALRYGFQQLEKMPFCLRLIKELHAILLEGVRGGTTQKGEFRTHQVHLGSTRRFVPPPPGDELNQAMSELEKYINDPRDDFDPLVRCFLIHYQLEAIHPFSDGNGRIGRVVLSLMIYKWCHLKMPWLYLSPFYERYKDEYIDLLFKISSEAGWHEWLRFCLQGVIAQSLSASDKCMDLHALREEMHERTAKDGRARVHAIIDDLFENPIVRIADLARKRQVLYPTAKSDVEYLIVKGILTEMPNSKVKTFYAPSIFAIAYKDENQQ